MEEIVPNGDYSTDLIRIVIMIVPEIIVANLYILLSSDSESGDDVANSLQTVYVNLPTTGGSGAGDMLVVVG